MLRHQTVTLDDKIAIAQPGLDLISAVIEELTSNIEEINSKDDSIIAKVEILKSVKNDEVGMELYFKLLKSIKENIPQYAMRAGELTLKLASIVNTLNLFTAEIKTIDDIGFRYVRSQIDEVMQDQNGNYVLSVDSLNEMGKEMIGEIKSIDINEFV